MVSLLPHLPSDPQAEVVQRYCAEAEKRIAEAKTHEEAASARETLCSRLREDCTSGLLVHATEEYITRLIEEKFHANDRARD